MAHSVLALLVYYVAERKRRGCIGVQSPLVAIHDYTETKEELRRRKK